MMYINNSFFEDVDRRFWINVCFDIFKYTYLTDFCNGEFVYKGITNAKLKCILSNLHRLNVFISFIIQMLQNQFNFLSDRLITFSENK